MTVNELLNYFSSHSKSYRRSALEISRRTHSSEEDVRKAKSLYRTSYKNIVTQKPIDFPKILIFDIETAPVKAFVWKLWKENICIDQIIDDWFVICWSAKWLYSNEMLGECLTSQEIKQENDERIVKKLWELFDQADIVVAHNGGKFDVPKMNVRFLYHGLVPPTPYRIIDTYQVAKKQFKFTSNKLDALAVFFGLPTKLDTDFTLWKDCLEGKQDALDYMFKYNKYDVELLESVYLKILPWIRNHPNIANYITDNECICSNCGSYNVTPIKDRYYKTQVGTYTLYRCKECGAISRGRLNTGNRPATTSIANQL